MKIDKSHNADVELGEAIEEILQETDLNDDVPDPLEQQASVVAEMIDSDDESDQKPTRRPN